MMLKIKNYTYYLSCILIFLALWHIFSYMYDSMFFPSPIKVLISVIEILSSTGNYKHIAYTSFRVVASLGIALIAGTSIGILPAYNKQAEYFITSVIYPLLQSMPTIAWIFLIIIWFGLVPISPVIVLTLALLPVFILNSIEGMKEIDESLLELGKSYTKNRIRIFQKIILPSLYPYIFSALRIDFAAAWRIILIVEFFTAMDGVGYMLNTARDVYDVTKILSWVAIICSIIISFDYGIFEYFDKKTIRKWKNMVDDEI